jgi:RNA polymerase sigma factor (sigma-70 family)
VTEALRRVPEGQSDAALIAAVRRGDTNAYGVLYERHLAAAKRAAAYLAATAAEREDLVAEAFTRVLQVLRSGRGPAQEFRPYLLVTMRHAAINAARRGPSTALFADVPDAYLPAVTDDPLAERMHGNEAASAFAELPERWRQVLWHTEVEGAPPAAIAPMLGLTPNGVAALAYRAREGLREAYLKAHLPPAVEPGECRAAADKLARWVRRSISASQSRKLAAHLDRCARCRKLAAGLREVNGGLGANITPITWLSALKGAVAVKLGTAAAFAAVTAVTIVASEPPIAHERQAPAVAGPVAELPSTNRTNTEVRVLPVPGQLPGQSEGGRTPMESPPADTPASSKSPARPEQATQPAQPEIAGPQNKPPVTESLARTRPERPEPPKQAKNGARPKLPPAG